MFSAPQPLRYLSCLISRFMKVDAKKIDLRNNLTTVQPDGSGQVKVDLGSDRDIYLARVDWAKDGRTLYVQREARDQKRLDLLAVDPATGKAKVILSETAKSWINLSDNFHPLSGGDFLWWSEKSGHGHLYRVHDGKWTALTSGDWEVKTLVAVDEKAGLAYFTGNRETPLEQQLYSAPITRPAAARQITASGWWNDAVMDAAASRAVTKDCPGDTIIAFIQAAIGTQRTVHHGHCHEIEVIGPDDARGVIAMEDQIWDASGTSMTLHGCGHYHEDYKRVDGRWRIHRSRISRLQVTIGG